MNKKRTWVVTMLALAAVVVSACGPLGGGAAQKTVYVGPYQVDCVGVGPQKCLLVKEDAEGDWTMYYDRIVGFDYEPGYEYTLRISEEKVKDPPADASSIRWTLVEVVEQSRSLEGTIWVMEAYLNSEGVLVSALPGSQASARFQAGNVGGSASCNSYFGTFTTKDDKLTIDVGGMTEMYCVPEELMAQEQAFLADLDLAASYRIAEDKLQIEDMGGTPVLTFSALKPATLVGPLWLLTGYNNGKGGFASVLADTEITATFAQDGRLMGTAGCNSYATSYQVSGNQITFGPVAATMMMCGAPEGIMEQEGAYLAALEAATTYQIEGNQLSLANSAGETVLTYMVREPTPLVGTEWEVIGYNNGRGGVVSVMLGTQLTAVFGEDGNVTGSAGCNNYFATYQIDGEALSIGPAASTRMFCGEPEGIMDQEAEYLAALQTAATYRIQGDKLELRDGGGALVANYVAKPQSPAEAGGAGLGEEALGNLEYKSGFTQSGTAPLVNGEYREPAAPGSATETVVTLTEWIAYGQLNGREAAAVILVTDPGGSGTFYDLAVVVEQGGQPVNVATTSLGDRVQVNSLTIENNEIVVDMITQGPDDPMCCPTQQVVRSYVLEGDQLVQTSN